MIWAGQFEKLLEVIRGQPHLALKITLGSGNELLIGVTEVLVVITLFTTIGGHNSLGPLLWPPPTAPDAPLCTLVGCCGWCSLTATQGYLPTALHNDGHDHLLAQRRAWW
jgi:hypothetical protein